MGDGGESFNRAHELFPDCEYCLEEQYTPSIYHHHSATIEMVYLQGVLAVVAAGIVLASPLEQQPLGATDHRMDLISESVACSCFVRRRLLIA